MTSEPLTTAHTHLSSCWWDHTEARWSCASTTTSGADADVQPLVDVRDMLVVHTAMLREFRLAPAAVRRVPVGDADGARAVDRHLGLLCDLLHHHHSGEDELLWPVLRGRLRPDQVALLDVAEGQHAGIDQALEAVQQARPAWVATPGGDAAQRLAAALEVLHGLLREHLEAEETQLLPLAAAHLTPAEWEAVGRAGAESVPKRDLPLVLGMFAYEGDPVVLATMLSSAPLPVRTIVPRVAPRLYARRALQVHGTRRP